MPFIQTLHKKHEKLPQCQLFKMFIAYIAAAAGTCADIIIIADRKRPGERVVDRSAEEQGVGIDMMLGAVVEYGPVGYGIAPLHGGKGRRGQAECDSNIFVMDLSLFRLRENGLELCDDGQKVIHGAIIGQKKQVAAKYDIL